jgi:hypothetical protein
MADRWPLANGNWSNAANWNGGTLPAAGDDVFADGKTVTIDQDVTVLSVRTTQRSGGTAGGSFVHNQGYTLTADVYLQVNNSVNNFSNNSQIIGNIYGVNGSGINNGINCTGSAKITGNIVGFYNGTSTFIVTKGGIGLIGTLEIIGNIDVTQGNTQVGVSHSSSGINSTVIITGNVTAGNANANTAVRVANTSGASITEITGNITGSGGSGNAYGLEVTSAFATVTVYGNSIGGSAAVGTLVSGASTVTIEKATAGSLSTASIAGVSCTSATATVVVREAEFGANGQVPLAGFIRFENSINNKITVTKEDDSTVTLVDINDASVYLPAEADVRDGVLYDPDLASEGTLIVPDPSNVRNGVPTDNTVGTADLTAQDFFDAIASSSDPIAIRLRNVATVETTGDQISAFNV